VWFGIEPEEYFMTQQRISELPREERPSYKIEEHPQAMSSRELLALLIGGENQIEIAGKLYQSCNGNLLKLGKDSTPGDIEGIGKVTSDRILAAIQLGQKLATPTYNEPVVIHSPEDAADLVQYEMSALTQEELRVIILNTRNHVIKVVTIYKGSLNSSQVRIGEIFRPAIKHNAAAIIVVHNHPSSDPSPSLDDQALTASIVKAGKLLDIELLDHLIIGSNRFISLNRRGLGFDDEQQYPEGQSESTDKIPETTDNNKERVKEKRVVAMSKPLPKMLQDLKKSEQKSPSAVHLVVDKKGNVIATTLRKQVVEKEQNK
jgi:DNA repair protein RadC